MDDMDNQSVEMGGTRSFFDGEFRRFAWQELLSPQNGGQEMLNIYSEAISKMPENPGIPTLFRDIFKNAYLPYRDPETLRLFLKTIDQFEYDHSENLGDAFEYLLSVMSSQGDAGQFRTPRHIIDFMVAVMNPQKHEQVMDPACGTAGFLISAYKHISQQNSRSFPLDMLSPEEHHRLMQGFTGYDISPDMVRLSLVNMYLHGFTDPHIYEYDTLTSEERWDRYADVILANPPFMSPKGGIRPHNRFSVKSNRSEVLFVDYIAEHLTANGRAAVIVPEGIIFQSQNAYKQLRQMLVENSLYAVVSLPSGVFAPYSGVKTSVLLMDKQLAKRCDSVLFLKISSDGFSIGAQRRETEKNDLPDSVKLIHEYQGAVDAGNTERFQALDLPCEALLVSKARLAENGDYGLSMERYRAVLGKVQHKWPMVKLGDVCEINPETIGDASFNPDDEIRYVDISCVSAESGKIDFSNKVKWSDAPSRARRLVKPDDVLLSTVRPNLRAFARICSLPDHVVVSTGFAVLRPHSSLLPSYLYTVICQDVVVRQMVNMMGKGAYPSINTSDVNRIQIPLPPLEVQREIVEEIEGYQRIIDGARQVVDNWKPRIDIDPAWPLVKLGEVCERIMDGTHYSPENGEAGAKLYVTAKNIKENGIDLSSVTYITEDAHRSIYGKCPVQYGDVLYIKDGATAGVATINTLDEEFSLLSSVAVMRGRKTQLSNNYLYYYLNSDSGKRNMLQYVGGVAITRLTLTKLNNVVIPLPPIDLQQQIAGQLDAERMQVQGCRELITAFEARIKQVIDRVWER